MTATKIHKLGLVSVLAGLIVVDIPLASAVDFNRDIRGILSGKCFACHGPDAKSVKADLRLDQRDSALKIGAIVPGNPEKSSLVHRIFTSDPDDTMPPPESKKELTAREKELLKKWIAEGAEYQDHWAFIPPKKKPLPKALDSRLTHNPIDNFVQARLAIRRLRLSPEASKETLVRRASLDLTGLPPAPAEVDEFVKDSQPGAYEKLIDRLLKSKRFGERMALAWMDAARYGDTSVMHADGPRDMWPWRDWVINAYNSNMPFDQFTTEQLAGDLLPDATVQQKVASGFNRNHASSDEGGAIAEELRVEYVVDRVKTTSTVWLGLTMECGQCHDHKYDPISQKEYYQFYAYFNNTTDPGMQTRNGNQTPVVEVLSDTQLKTIAKIREDRSGADKELTEHKQNAKPAIEKWAMAFATNKDARLPEPKGLSHHFPLDETGGSTVKDSLDKSVGKLSGQLIPTKTEDGEPGLKFDGKTAYAFDEFSDYEYTQPFTFSAWVKLPKSSGGAIFSRMDVGKAYRGYDFWVQGRNIGTHVINTWPNNALKVVSNDPLPENKWTHVCLTYDGGAKAAGVKIYFNGKLQKNKVEQDRLKATVMTSTPFKIGSRSEGTFFTGEVSDLRIYNRALSDLELPQVGNDQLKKILEKEPSKWSKKEREKITDYYLNNEDKGFPKLFSRLNELKRKEGEVTKNLVTSMIMQDNLKSPRMTYMLNRGQYDQPLKENVISPGVPTALGPLPEGAPPNRLGLAQWLTKPDHPLTARVAVNRLWAMFYGDGLIRTQGDFGNQGGNASHPELLDWLAADFFEHGWDVKRLIKQMLMSYTYRQSGRSTEQHLRLDPENRLLARSPRFRLQGEFIRDLALAASGLLTEKIGGPGVKPYQPTNIWNEISLNGGLRYPQDKGEKLYRRSMYTYWKRSSPMPNMLIFDAPSREKCVVKRPRTNTPLQALVTLNDPQFVEAARALAEKLIHTGGATVADKINSGYRLIVSRSANSRELAILTDTYEEQLAEFKADVEKAKKFLAVGESKRDESIDAVEHAAWMVISQMILNLDEALTRG